MISFHIKLVAFVAAAITIASSNAQHRDLRPSCNSLAEGVHLVDPSRCDGYYVCTRGRAVHYSCRFGQFYDELSQSCKLSNLVNCLNFRGVGLRVTASVENRLQPTTTPPCESTTTPCNQPLTTTCEPEKTTTPSCEPEKPTTTPPCEPEKPTTTSCEPEKPSTTTPCEPEKPTTPCEPGKSTTPCEPEKTTTTPCEPEKTTTTPCESVKPSTTPPCKPVELTTTPCESVKSTTTREPEKTSTREPETTSTLEPGIETTPPSLAPPQRIPRPLVTFMSFSKEDCHTRTDGTFLQDAIHCRQYYECQGGVRLLRRCRIGNWFDVEAGECRRSRLVLNCPANRN
ncbi:merozoite surface protein CMZ-8 isoform X40 [Drosophila albomicans]|uniref:Merozoite surface protein CMZ-8 isoform X40 n=1 Tax=Drosophila albomicans TaxID=7291 RepID=A0A9C6T246_DROAB|nr:merozoite surface protein CMZ-8 isoform X40 [Drosophila albomicans]